MLRSRSQGWGELTERKGNSNSNGKGNRNATATARQKPGGLRELRGLGG